MTNIAHTRLLELMQGAQSSAKKMSVDEPAKINFGDMLKDQLSGINDVMVHAKGLQEKYAMGDDSVTLPSVMIASEKSSLALNFTVEVRNKIINAFNEIQNMAV